MKALYKINKVESLISTGQQSGLMDVFTWNRWNSWITGITLSLLTAAALSAAETTSDFLKAADLSFDELMDIEVTSVSKKQVSILESTAAVSVITSDDIRRSGAVSLPEALRLAPGLQVARANANTWAISARGFNGVFSNKLLVMIDGRTIYNPLFSGVDWDMHEMVLEDIEQIEVVRGPGGTLWGANAVNGVINIITKPAKDTIGSYLTTGVGTENLATFVVRHGAQLSDNSWLRIYAMHHRRDDAKLATGLNANDQWNITKAGFRADFEPNSQNTFTLQGDAMFGKVDQTPTIITLASPIPTQSTATSENEAANVLGTWTHFLNDGSEIVAQSYFDYFARPAQTIGQERSTGDFEIQHRIELGARHEIVYGGNYRVTKDTVDDAFLADVNPDSQTVQQYGGFIQDEIAIIEDRLSLTLGSKLSHNDFTGFEYQPSVRLFWRIDDTSSAWGAVSRAVRTPARVERDLSLAQAILPAGSIPGAPPLPALPTILGSRTFNSEELLSFELGYRNQLNQVLSVDIAGYYNDYDNLRSLEPGLPFPAPTPFAPTHLVVPIVVRNGLSAETYGTELGINVQISPDWRLRGNYNYLKMNLHTSGTSTDTTSELQEGGNPQHQFSLRSQHELPWNLELDAGLRYVDSLSQMQLPSYLLADIRLSWRPTENWEFAIVGQNLLDSQHPEFQDQFNLTLDSEIQHAVYASATWRF